MTYLRDKPNAEVIVFKEAIIQGVKSGEKYMSINITNTGRRPLKIFAVSYKKLWQFGKTAVIIADSPLPKKLDEGEDVVCMFRRSVLESGSWKGVAYVFASDTTGKQYRKNIAPFYLAWFHRYIERLIGPILRGIHRFKNRKDDY
jgi:hypothetical protein